MNKLIKYKLGIIIFFCFSFCSCYYSESHEYKKYYDENESQLKVHGYFNSDFKEIGHWKYFSKEGKILQEGDFQNGLMTGDWNYRFEPKDSIVKWKTFRNNEKGYKLEVNIPASFVRGTSQDNQIINVVDSTNKDAIAVKLQKFIDESTLLDIYELMKKEAIELYGNGETESQKVTLINGDYYYYNYFIFNDKEGQIIYYNFLGKIENKAIEVILKTRRINLGKVIFGDIIQHLYINEKRINNPLEGIKEMVVVLKV